MNRQGVMACEMAENQNSARSGRARAHHQLGGIGVAAFAQAHQHNNEPYEEPLNEIPEVSVSTTQTEDTRQTVVYYEDGDGYLVPVQRDVARQDGIAKATLELMVQNPRNDMDAARPWTCTHRP